MRGDLLALGDDLVARLRERRAADDQRARAVGAHAELHLVGVAEHDVDILERHAEFLADDLRVGRLVTLAVIVRADKHGDLAGRVDAHGRALIKTAARAEPSGDARWRQAAGLDIGAEPDAAQLAVARRCRLAFGEARPIRCHQRLFQAAFRIAAVIFHHDRRLVRIRLFGDHVAAADLGVVDSHVACGDVDQPLQHEGRLRPAGAAIGIDRHRVGEHHFHFAIDRRRHDKRRRAAARRDWSGYWDRRSRYSRRYWRAC